MNIFVILICVTISFIAGGLFTYVIYRENVKRLKSEYDKMETLYNLNLDIIRLFIYHPESEVLKGYKDGFIEADTLKKSAINSLYNYCKNVKNFIPEGWKMTKSSD